jgi:predicted cation transporter
MDFMVSTVDMGLFGIFLLVLLCPFFIKKVEEQLEAFLFVMGVSAVTIANAWHLELVIEAVEEPIMKGIVPAVLVAGLIFYYGRSHAKRIMDVLLDKVPLKILVFMIVVILGLSASLITAIIAALVLVEVVSLMPLDRNTKIKLTVVACFSIGLGAALTPVGEPLSTIAITKLQGPPYHAGFFFLLENIGVYIIPGVLAFGILSAFIVGKKTDVKETDIFARGGDTLRDVGIRGAKVYLFVMALLLLGSGFKIIIDTYLIHIPAMILYWVNMSSAVLDNATLTAAEIGPSMDIFQIKAILMGLLVSGGMLIPGNIPNIISANKMGITSKEWARTGVPIGLVAMLVYFVWLFYLH